MADTLLKTTQTLLSFLRQALYKKLDPERLARVGFVLSSKQNDWLFSSITEYILQSQQPDGGWVDVEETAWALAYLRTQKLVPAESFQKGLSWLESQKDINGGWGRNNRDKPRIPYTSWVLIQVPELSLNEALRFLEYECTKELSTEPVLSYKVALPLRAFWKNNFKSELKRDLLSLLIQSQNDDGGFGPWKGHPLGSDPLCTGVSVLGLLTEPEYVPGEIFRRAFDWLVKNQLPNGLWPYHYIDEGSAIAYWALKELLIYFKEKF